MTGTGNTIKLIADIPSKPWTKKTMPQRILAIRLQAMGDMVITLPYLQQLKKMLPPNTKLDLLTREEVHEIPRNILLFNKIHSIKGGRNFKKQLLYTGLLLPKLLLQRYDVVVDLQNNILSRIVRKSLMPKAWSEFDRFSPVAAGESTRLTIEAIRLGECFADKTGFQFKYDNDCTRILKANGWDGESELVVLNPAGAFITRNWPVDYYIDFAKLWSEKFPRTQFLIIGVHTIAEKTTILKKMLGNKLIDLVNKTNPVQAFALIQKTKLVLSEDSGLMHMAWVSGIPTLAIFGSTKSQRSTPLGDHTLLLHSGDLECGNCMQEICRHGDTHCLTRYTAAFVFKKALKLIGNIQE
ncbi:glycosyltransferase family 9 protein [Ferruginibacter sp. SUN106]|uniref:glycosyltransferase family 9 protein n=1 Tax=Ferruginibacter sp. SUN106 TaxID=2978348 RepID=UPI003D36C34F